MTTYFGGWRLLGVSFAVCLVLTLCSVALGDQGFVTIDDVVQMLILSGHMAGGEPSPFVYFSNVLGGVVLSTLFTWVPSINWYTLALVVTHVVSSSAVTFAVLRGGTSPWHWLLVSSIWTLEAQFLVNLQFTHTAMAASCAGLALISLAGMAPSSVTPRAGSDWSDGDPRLDTAAGASTFSVGMAVTGICLACVGSLIRFEGFVLVLLLFAPPLVYVASVTAARRERRVALAVLVLTLLVGLGLAVDRAVYARTPGWAAFRTFWTPMSRVLDGPLVTQFPERPEASRSLATALERVGWSPDQWELFTRYRFLEDPEVFTVEAVAELATALRTKRRPSEMAELLLLQKSAFAFAVPMSIIAIVPLFPGVLRSGRGRYALLLLAVCLVTAVLIGFLLWIVRLPRHVRLPLVYVFGVMSVLGTSRMIPARGGWLGVLGLARVALVTSLVISLAGGVVVAARSRSAHRTSRAIHQEITRRLLPDTGKLYFLANFEYLRTLPPWTRLDEQPRRFLPVAGLMRTPLMYDTLRLIGERSLIDALSRNDARIVGQKRFLDLLRAHLEDRHGTPVRLVVLDVVGSPPSRGGRDKRIFSARLENASGR